jgi:lipoprotein-anchoring transpeptidase ErfK/SrfK
MRAGIAVALTVALAGCGASPRPSHAPAPERLAPSFEPAPARAAAAARSARRSGRHRLARLTRATLLRTTPGGRSVGRISTRTEFGSRTVLSVLRRRGAWLEVVVAQRPNGRPAWIPASRARLSATDYLIVVDRSARRLTLRRGGRALRRFRVAVGRPGNPTPTGRFAVTDRLRPGRVDSPYGCCILALTGHQTALEPGWPGGDRLAIHHTPATWSIGRRASLGCMRGSRRDLEYLMRRVPLGTPVVVRA